LRRFIPGYELKRFRVGNRKGGNRVGNRSDANDWKVPVRIHPELKELTRHYDKKIYRIGEIAYSAVGFGLGNSAMIEGDDGIIIFDTGREVESAREVSREFRKITDKPIKAIIYSHFHMDHTGGVKGFVSEDEVRSGKVEIIAHESLMSRIGEMESKALPIFGQRLRYQFGAYLDGEDVKDMCAGLGPLMKGGTVSFIAPTKTFADRLETVVSGIRMILFHVPCESEDQIALFVPDIKAAFVGDLVHGPSWPNLYPLWGDRDFRDPEPWANWFNLLLSLGPRYFVPMHGQPILGEKQCRDVIGCYRDAFQFLNDQTIRYMNRGHTPDELVEIVKLPPHLADIKPYLRDYVGSFETSVRRVYDGYLGWFSGDGTELSPTPFREKARRLVELMGGRERIMESARKAYTGKEYQWAAELITYLIHLDPDDMEARNFKAAAFRQLGYGSRNAQYRHWYLTSARELEGRLPKHPKMAFDVADVTRCYSSEFIIKMVTSQLKAEETYDVLMTLCVEISDSGEKFWMELRRGVVIVHSHAMHDSDVGVRMTRDFLNTSKFQPDQIIAGIRTGEVSVTGKTEDAVRFFGFFEKLGEDPINISIH
jgi:alkyl sulfatase BDS1-like metallo-beta-lactamase superfamily hydrolase